MVPLTSYEKYCERSCVLILANLVFLNQLECFPKFKRIKRRKFFKINELRNLEMFITIGNGLW